VTSTLFGGTVTDDGPQSDQRWLTGVLLGLLDGVVDGGVIAERSLRIDDQRSGSAKRRRCHQAHVLPSSTWRTSHP
jgi:hypothetical protein